MLLQKKINIVIAVLLAVLTSACSNSKRLHGGETLFKGSKVNIKDNATSRNERKILQGDLIGVVRPRPNSKFLGIRAKLTLYNLAGVPRKEKGFRKWMRNKVGEPPVLASGVNLLTNKELMINLMQNKGYFYSKVTAEMKTDSNRKKSTAVFDVTTGPQYHINKVYFRKDSSAISKEIDRMFKRTLLKEGTSYNLDVIKAERDRIDRRLKNKGYFFFRSDYILVKVDSSIGDHKVNMYVQLKHREIPEEAYKMYVIDNIYIYSNYRLRGKNDDTSKANQVLVDDYYVVDRKKTFKPEVFSDVMVFDKGDRYSLKDQNASLSRLVNMGVFKFVKNRFEPTHDSLMDVFYYLTPYPKKSLRFEAGVLTQNDNRAGTQGSVSWRNRNAFRGAEELMFKVNGGFEAQYTGAVRRPTIYNFGLESTISFPRFVVPFINIHTTSTTLPRSVIRLKYNYESQSDLLRINSYTASYGYAWKEGSKKQHQLYPINFTYVKTDTLGSLDSRQFLYNNLTFNGIIVGPTYEFTYNSQAGRQRKQSFYFDGLIDLSGNILGIVKKANYETNPDLLFGSTYAQYVKLQPDFRYYYRFTKATTIATRLLGGFGIPYGNSRQLPNIKQFWAGGNSDLRGFPSRLVGPGAYHSDSNRYIQTLGDIKLEGNIELRQNVYKFINLGLFVDAGNVWLYRDNPDFPGGTFSSGFYKELAADAGIGLRLDFKILILRLDLGMPIRKPWLPEGERWVFDKIQLADPTWKKQNLVFNIAIGYPF